jgi:hypothetical protein
MATAGPGTPTQHEKVQHCGMNCQIVSMATDILNKQAVSFFWVVLDYNAVSLYTKVITW